MTKIVQQSNEPITNYEVKRSSRFATQPIVLETNGIQIQANKALKQEINIVYDENGHIEAPIDPIDLGMQYDNRATWLKFNFDKLLWHDEVVPNDDYEKANRYDKYLFRVYFKRPEESLTFIYELNPFSVFEVPYTITQHLGYFEMAVSIQDLTEDNWEGNTPYIESFITDAISCIVNPTLYDPTWSLAASTWSANQLKSLTKIPLSGELSDLGQLKIDSTDWGIARDNYVKYIRFDLNRITANLDNLTIVAIFYNPETDTHYNSLVQQSNPDDPYDDHTENYPYITWIPQEVYAEMGTWELILIAYAGTLPTKPHTSEQDEHYYFYISTIATGEIKESLITSEDLQKPSINTADSNFITRDGAIIYTKDNKIFNTAEVKNDGN